jgi:hypothetical protein
MGLFDALFGPSVKERMQPYFQGRGQTMHERISRCVREIYPTLELRDITPFHEAGCELTASADGSNEAQAIFSACAARAGMKVIAMTMQKGADPSWRVIINSDSVGTATKPSDRLAFAKYRNVRTRVQIWMCLHDDDTPMMDIVADSEWERLT